MPQSQIIHLDLDTFFVSVERLQDSRLNGLPVLIGSPAARGVVASCSYEARTFGIHSAMPMKTALQLCPHATVIRGDSGTYSRYSDLVTEIIQERAPLYEKSSIDEFYIDASGMDRFFGTWKWARELRQKIIRETGLPLSFAMSNSKTVAKVATGEAKPNGEMLVAEGTEKAFLAPLPVKRIPMVGAKMQARLRDLGLVWIRTVQDMPIAMLERAFGKHGTSLWKKANGIDNAPVVPYQERKSISMERTFDRDTIDHHKLQNMVMAMSENLAYQLRAGRKLTACVAVKIRYADFSTHTMQSRIPYTASDDTIRQAARTLFEKLYNRRLLVRLIGVRCSHIVNGHYQISMFDDTTERIALYQAMDRMKRKYGSRAVQRAYASQFETLGSLFNPFNGLPPVPPAHRKQ